MRRYYQYDEPITAQSLLRKHYESAMQLLQEQEKMEKERVWKKIITDTPLWVEIEALKERFHTLTGRSLDLQYAMDPATTSPMGKVMEKALQPIEDKAEQIGLLYTEASLRVSLGKGADAKLEEIQKFKETLEKIVVGGAKNGRK